MADYLRRNDLAALWYHPSENVQTVFVAYASSSTSWSFLDNNINFPPNANLRISARSYLPPISSIRQTMPPPAVTPSTERPEDQPMPPADETNDDIGHVGEVDDGGNESEDSDVPTYKPLFAPTPLPANVANMDIVAVFQERWGITHRELSRVNNSSQKDHVARAFFLYFPLEVEEEFQLILRFLKTYTNAIFTNRLEGDWERFVETVTAGTVLVSN